MSDVGILRTRIGVESHQRRGDVRELADTLVDTGSEYSWIPRDVLESLGIGIERAQRFRTADGRVVHRVMGYAIIHAGGTRTSDEVVFAEPGDMVLLGAHTLEGLNLRVDLKTKQLIPAGPVPAALTAWLSSADLHEVAHETPYLALSHVEDVAEHKVEEGAVAPIRAYRPLRDDDVVLLDQTSDVDHRITGKPFVDDVLLELGPAARAEEAGDFPFDVVGEA
jgi:predicted aspartyl protease